MVCAATVGTVVGRRRVAGLTDAGARLRRRSEAAVGDAAQVVEPNRDERPLRGLERVDHEIRIVGPMRLVAAGAGQGAAPRRMRRGIVAVGAGTDRAVALTRGTASSAWQSLHTSSAECWLGLANRSPCSVWQSVQLSSVATGSKPIACSWHAVHVSGKCGSPLPAARVETGVPMADLAESGTRGVGIRESPGRGPRQRVEAHWYQPTARSDRARDKGQIE